MPRSPRRLNIRKLGECRKHTSWINYHLTEIAEQYRENYPEWFTRFSTAIELNKTLDELLEFLENSL